MNDMMNLDKWAENLTQEVYSEWKTKYAFWEHGFKVFFSPVYKNPKLMILTLNPGGNKINDENENMRNFRKNNFSIPTHNEYFTKDHHMANKAKLFFEGHHELLKQSVVLPIIFFRSENWKYWKKNAQKNKRREMEQLSYLKVKEIIKVLKPKKILVIGMGTFDKIKKNILEITDEESIRSGPHRLYVISKNDKTPIFCIPHLTGYHLSDTKHNQIQEAFFNKFLVMK